MIPRHRLRRGRYPYQQQCLVCLGWEGGAAWFLHHIPWWKVWEREDRAAVERYASRVNPES